MIGKNLFGETGEKPVRARRRETRDKLQIPFGSRLPVAVWISS